MSFYAWKPYVPVATRREQAAKKLAKMQRKGAKVSPVLIEGRTIASSFWGKAWCENLERYSDFASRLPRGRTYVRNGSVLDLQIAKGEVRAQVSGSKLYSVKITMAPVTGARWKAICRDCAGCIDSLVELLQGRVSKGVMDRVCREGDGLFPAPREIRMSCSCPDWADMCKHVAAVLYGVGARLDHSPALLSSCAGLTRTSCSHEPVKTVLCQDQRRPQPKCWMKAMSPPCSDWRWTPSRAGTTLPARSLSAPRRRNARTDPPDVRPPRARTVLGHAQAGG